MGFWGPTASQDPEEQSARHSDSDANPLEGLARGVFVGRESQLERLHDAFDEAFVGRGSVVMLVGEPGIGKTRTTQELETYARMRGARVLWGRAHSLTSGATALASFGSEDRGCWAGDVDLGFTESLLTSAFSTLGTPRVRTATRRPLRARA